MGGKLTKINVPAITGVNGQAYSVLKALKMLAESMPEGAEVIERTISKSGYNGATDTTVPPEPTNVTLSAAFQNIIITWDSPFAQYANHSHTEIRRSTDNDYNNSSVIFTTNASVHADATVVLGQDYYYWLINVSDAGVRSIIPAPSGPVQLATVDINNFATSMSPVEILNDTAANLPPAGQQGRLIMVMLPTPKLYRDNGTAWIIDVDPIDIAPSSILAGSIQANTITGNNIAAGTITAASGVIADLAVENGAIGLLQVDTAQIANLAVGQGDIASLQVQNSKFQLAAIKEVNIKDASIEAASITTLNATKITGDINIFAAAEQINSPQILINSTTWKKIGGPFQLPGSSHPQGHKPVFYFNAHINSGTTGQQLQLREATSQAIIGQAAYRNTSSGGVNAKRTVQVIGEGTQTTQPYDVELWQRIHPNNTGSFYCSKVTGLMMGVR